MAAGLGTALLPAVLHADVAGVGVAVAAVFLIGLGNQAVNVTVIGVRQVITPNRVLGRVNASAQLVPYGLARSAPSQAACWGRTWGCAAPWRWRPQAR